MKRKMNLEELPFAIMALLILVFAILFCYYSSILAFLMLEILIR